MSSTLAAPKQKLLYICHSNGLITTGERTQNGG